MSERLRVVTFNVFPPAYQVIAEWAERHGDRVLIRVADGAIEATVYPKSAPV